MRRALRLDYEQRVPQSQYWKVLTGSIRGSIQLDIEIWETLMH